MRTELAARGLGLSVAVAVAWRIGVPLAGKTWPLGLDALFRTDLPPLVALLVLARALASDAPLTRFERWRDGLFLVAGALPFLPLRMPLLVTLATALYVAILASWAIPAFAAAGRGLKEPGRPSPRALAALFCCFAAVYGGVGRYTCHVAAPTGDEPHYLMVAHSLWQDGDLDLADDFADKEYWAFYPAPFGPRPWDLETPDGKIYSWGGAAFPALLAVPYGLGGRSGAVLAVNLATALAVVLCYRLAQSLGGSPERSFQACLAGGISLPVLAYSSLLYPETVAGLLLILALATTSQPLAFLLLLGLSLLRAKYLALALPVALVLAAGHRARGSRLAAVGFLLVLVAYVAADFWLLRGEYSGRILGYLATAPGQVLVEGRVGRLLGLWFDQEGGVLLYSPLIAAGVLELPALARNSRIGLAAAAAALVYSVAAAAAYDGWYGEWWFPGRFLVPVVFLLMVAWGASPGAGPSRWRPLAVYGALQAAALALALVLSPRLAYNYADGTASVLDALEGLLGLPVCRYFPSLIRPTEPSQWLSVAFLALAAAGLRFRRPGSRMRDVGLGALIFAGVWALPVLGQRLVPTRVIEVEDTLIQSRRAQPWPPGRPYHQRLALGDLRLGLRLPPQASLETDILTGRGSVGFLVTASAQGGDGVLEVWLTDILRQTLTLPAGQWGPFGAYTLKDSGLRRLRLRNAGRYDILVDRIDVHRP